MDALIQKALDMWRDSVPTDPTVENWRVATVELYEKFGSHDDAIVSWLDADGVPVLRIEAPGARDDQTIVHFHSGGYVMGNAEIYKEYAYRLSAATHRPVLIPDYRLAPEHLFPAPVEDALTVYRWLTKSIDPKRIVITGDSAGGGLAIALLVALRDAGDELPAALSVQSPLTDLAVEGESMVYNKDTDPCVSHDLALDMGVVYIGDRDPKQTPLGSPLYADLHGLPPVQVQASSSETLLDDSTRRLVKKITESGGIADLTLYADVPHVWAVFPFLKESAAVMSAVADFLDEHVAVAV